MLLLASPICPAAALPSSFNVPLVFEPTQGQSGASASFISRANGRTLLLAPGSTEVVLRDGTAFHTTFLHANPAPDITGIDPLPGQSSYFFGNDPHYWQTSVPQFARVRYRSLYPGIDLIYHGNGHGGGRDLEYDFVVAPGADPRVIQLAFDPDTQLRLAADGSLVLRRGSSQLLHHKPVIYQISNGAQKTISGRYTLKSSHRVAFALGAYDKSKPLVIDPVLAFSTYLGGSSNDNATGIAVDPAGNIYVTGSTTSADFPTTPFPLLTGTRDTSAVFISKLSPTGKLLYSTYLGGNGGTTGSSIAVDADGNVYVTGSTASSNFPTTPGAFQKTLHTVAPAQNAFVLKLNATGNLLLYSTYVGGSRGDTAVRIALDPHRNAYITGYTYSADFPTNPGSLRPKFMGGSNPGIDAFVAKLSVDGSSLVYSTFLGGNDWDVASGIAVDAAGSTYVVGTTNSTDFPVTPGALQPNLSKTYDCDVNFRCTDGFLIKLSTDGSAAVYSTYIGNPKANVESSATSVALDAAGNAYVTDYRTLTKFNAAGTGIVFSLAQNGLGALGFGANYVALDGDGNIYLAGQTADLALPLVQGFEAAQNGPDGFNNDGYIAKVDASGGKILYSTYLGGTHGDSINALAVDPAGNAYVAGFTFSTDFPVTTGAIKTQYQGDQFLNGDAFVAKIAAVNSGPYFLQQGVVNAASYNTGPVSPGEILTIFGSALGPDKPAGLVVNPTGLVDTALARTLVLFDGVPAPVLYTSAGQVNLVAPFGLTPGGVTKIQVEYNGVPSAPVTLPVVAATPGLFTAGIRGSQQGAIINQDGSLNSPGHPAPRGSIVAIYMTGGGALNPSVPDGTIIDKNPPLLQGRVTASIFGVPAEVVYAGAAPTLVAGVVQVNVRVPAGVPANNFLPVVVNIGQDSQPLVKVSVR